LSPLGISNQALTLDSTDVYNVRLAKCGILL
jgi:hypothetical protein